MLTSIKSNFQTVHRSVPPNRVRAEEESRTLDYLRARLRAVVILAGSVRTDPLAQVAGRARAGLPLTASETVLDHWVTHARELAAAIGRPDLELRLLLSRGNAVPAPKETGTLNFDIREDSDSFRGTGGLLHDVAGEYPDDDLLLIVSGAQILREKLSRIAISLSQRQTAIALAVRPDGTPCDLTLASVKALRTIRGNGYVDFKEQCLPDLARAQPVGIIRSTGKLTFPVRNLSEYIRALRIHHANPLNSNASDLPADTGQARFVIAESGATLHATARAFDSVFLSGSQVEAGAILVRCVVGPKAIIRAGAQAIDQLIGC